MRHGFLKDGDHFINGEGGGLQNGKIAGNFMHPPPPPIGRVRKNSGGKRQAYYQPQVTTGNRQVGRLLIAGYLCLSLLTIGFCTGLRPVCAPTHNQEPIHLACTCAYLWLVVGQLFFHRYFSLPPYTKMLVSKSPCGPNANHRKPQPTQYPE